jgi:hypothetical protein
MSTEDFQGLKDSIENIGVQNPITIFEGMVVDGWNRYKAANELGMDCPSKELDAWIDPVAFVRAQNKDRRHLPLSAWALIEVSLREWMPSHRPDKGELSSPLLASNQEMADAVGVTKRTIQQAKAVQSNATPEVIAAVKSGEIGLPKAAAIAKLPKEEQAAAIHKPAPKPAPAVVEPEIEAPPEYTELDAAHDQISELQAELVVARMGDIPEEEKQQAAGLIAELHAEIKTLNATLAAVTLSRDTLMEERAQMLRQMKAQRAEIDRLKSTK